MSVMFPYRRTTAAAVGLLVIDAPLLIAVAVLGWRYGYGRTWNTVMEYRLQHPWTFLPSLAMAGWVVRKWWRR